MSVESDSVLNPPSPVYPIKATVNDESKCFLAEDLFSDI